MIERPMPDERLTLEKILFISPTLETHCLGKFELEVRILHVVLLTYLL